MLVKSAKFIISNTDVTKCPKSQIPEYAFIGRSNVGKSSLINSICSKKNLAKTSSRPGKTQLINHFLINKKWYMVDLPGYGYAKTSKSNRAMFHKMISDYLTHRKNLICLFVLIDSRHELQEIDSDFMKWLSEKEIPFSIIFTKIDKLSKNKLSKNLKHFKKKMLIEWSELPNIFTSSAIKKEGLKEILDYINNLNLEFN